MVRQYRKVDEDFKSGAVRLVFETGKPIWQVARGLGSTRAPSATGLRWHAINVSAGTDHSARTSGRSAAGGLDPRRGRALSAPADQGGGAVRG
jgi:transposase-like protein